MLELVRCAARPAVARYQFPFVKFASKSR